MENLTVVHSAVWRTLKCRAQLRQMIHTPKADHILRPVEALNMPHTLQLIHDHMEDFKVKPRLSFFFPLDMI